MICGRTSALCRGCLIACHQNDLQSAENYVAESLTVSRAIADDPGIITALHGLGLVSQLQDEYPTAADWYEACIALERKTGHPRLSITLGNLAQVEHHRGNTTHSIELLTESIGIDRATGAISNLGSHMVDLGLILVEVGEDARAWMHLAEALEIHREVGYVRVIVVALDGLAALEVRHGRPERAARLFGAAQEIRERSGLPQEERSRWQYTGAIDQARQQLGDPAFLRARDAGQVMSMDGAIAYALAGPGL